MKLFNREMLSAYEKTDQVSSLLEKSRREGDEGHISHRWLCESLPKRMIYENVYGDLLEDACSSLSILDVAGGFCSITRRLINKHEYQLLDIMAHDKHEDFSRLSSSLGDFWTCADWYEFEPQHHYDLVIANDIFPNVDQRLELFLNKFLPVCEEMRLTLTYYNTPRFYKVRRLDAEEIFCYLAWNGEQVETVLRKYESSIKDADLSIIRDDQPSLFSNGRQVCEVRISGSARN